LEIRNIEKIYNKLTELSEIYGYARRAISLTEHISEDGTLFFEPINQLRNALFHLFEAIDKNNSDKIILTFFATLYQCAD